MFQHILVPVDFTEKNLAALRVAGESARHHHARLTLLHVIEELELLSTDEAKNFYRRLEERGRTRMAEFAANSALEGLEPQQKIVYGKRTQMILQTAEELGVDLIILSSHRIDPENAQGWGTISYQVALLAPCPILLVK